MRKTGQEGRRSIRECGIKEAQGRDFKKQLIVNSVKA